MPLDVSVIVDRNVILPVGSVVFIHRGMVFGREIITATVLDEEAGQLQVAFLAGGSPQLDKRQLNLRMSGIAHALGRSEDRVDVIGQLGRHGEKVGLARGMEMSHSRLDHVPRAVQFMIVAQVGPAPAWFLDDIVTVQITIGQLRCRKLGDDLVEASLERTNRRGLRVNTRRLRAPCKRPSP